jgi:nucleoside 2-deoxyribosyltransferase
VIAAGLSNFVEEVNMVDFIRKRLQVFVSSTYEDLKQERQAAVESILSAGHIPAGMELFAAGDESQMEVIKQWIDQSDVYLLILGGRYGSIEPKSGKSYTHLEYEYALEKKKALFACVVTDLAQETRIREHGSNVIEKAEPKKLQVFRELVLARMSRFWSDSKDIKLAIHETLNELSRRVDLIGWVRPQHGPDMPALADEIARLSNENGQLRQAIAIEKQEEKINGLTRFEVETLVKQKELLGYIIANRKSLLEGTTLTDKVAQLVALGMVINQPDTILYELTKRGQEIINKMEFEMLNTSK